jgi:mannosyltransferase OCH1-like enzyme
MEPFVINYMWNFKPGEEGTPDNNLINHNKTFVNNSNILSPEHIFPLVNAFSSELFDLWNQIPHWVIKADLGRLLYIYYHGQFYFDVDAVITRNFVPTFLNEQDKNVVLFIEEIVESVECLGPLECKNPENVVRIANYAFGSKVKNHPFLKEVVHECISRIKLYLQKKTNQLTHRDILWMCGPDTITTVYHRLKKDYPDILLLDKSFVKNLQFGSWRR